MNTSTAARLVSGRLAEITEDSIVLDIPHTQYRLHLVSGGEINARPGQRIRGRIDAHARRVDLCRTGGKFVDPLLGPPRTVQGRVVSNATGPDVLVVDAAIPIHARLRPPQTPQDFAEGDLVTFAIDPGATFTPVTG